MAMAILSLVPTRLEWSRERPPRAVKMHGIALRLRQQEPFPSVGIAIGILTLRFALVLIHGVML